MRRRQLRVRSSHEPAHLRPWRPGGQILNSLFPQWVRSHDGCLRQLRGIPGSGFVAVLATFAIDGVIAATCILGPDSVCGRPIHGAATSVQSCEGVCVRCIRCLRRSSLWIWRRPVKIKVERRNRHSKLARRRTNSRSTAVSALYAAVTACSKACSPRDPRGARSRSRRSTRGERRF